MIKPSFRKLMLPIAIATSLAACGGGGGGGGGGSSTASVAGSSSKGIIIGGIVNAYSISETGVVDKETPLATPTTTADDGSYSLTLNDSYQSGSAVYIEITAADGTVMKCDLQQCGEGVVFGQTYPLASNFTMSAIAPSAGSGDRVAVNVTPLTELASRLTLQKVASGARPSDAAAAANSQIADRFELSGGLIGQPIVDITSAEAVNGASKAALEYNLKAAGAVGAALAASSGGTVEEALEALATQFSSGGIADREEADSAAITVEELLNEALEILGQVKTLEGINAENEQLTQTDSSIGTAKSVAANPETGSTEASQGDVDPDAGSAGVVAAKQFVKQIRDLAVSTTIGTKQQAFADQIDLAAEAVSGEADAVAEALALSLAAIGGAYEAYQTALAEEAAAPTEFAAEGITVAITTSGGIATYAVKQPVPVGEVTVAIDLAAKDGSVFTDVHTDNSDAEPATYTIDTDLSLDLAVSGSAKSPTVSLTVNEDSALTGTLTSDEKDTVTEDEEGYSESWDDKLTASDFDAQLSVTLAQLVGENPVSFTGAMGLSIGSLAITNTGSFQNGFNEEAYFAEEEFTESIEIDDVELNLSGKFSNADDSLEASLTAMLDNFRQSCEISQIEDHQASNFVDSEECTEETAQDFATASLSINFTLDVTGVDEDVSVDFDASRTGLESGEATVQLSYNGKQLNLAYEGGNSVTLSNQNDVVLTLTEADDSLTGAITQNDVEYATVTDESGALLVRYTDGSVESAM